MENTFYSKYNEFCNDLEGAVPELKSDIENARNLSDEQKLSEYANVFKQRVSKDGTHPVLPGVTIPNTLWDSLSKNSQEAIEKYNSILDLCVIYHTGNTEGVSQEWVDSIMREWRTKMEKIDFTKLSSKFFDIFGKHGSSLPPLPEKFLKGSLAKLAEDLVKEFCESYFVFPNTINYGWWRLLQGKESIQILKSKWSIKREQNCSGICIETQPLLSIHTHFKTNDMSTILFNDFVKGFLEKLKSVDKTKKLLQFLKQL